MRYCREGAGEFYITFCVRDARGFGERHMKVFMALVRDVTADSGASVPKMSM